MRIEREEDSKWRLPECRKFRCVQKCPVVGYPLIPAHPVENRPFPAFSFGQDFSACGMHGFQLTSWLFTLLRFSSSHTWYAREKFASHEIPACQKRHLSADLDDDRFL